MAENSSTLVVYVLLSSSGLSLDVQRYAVFHVFEPDIFFCAFLCTKGILSILYNARNLFQAAQFLSHLHKPASTLQTQQKLAQFLLRKLVVNYQFDDTLPL